MLPNGEEELRRKQFVLLSRQGRRRRRRGKVDGDEEKEAVVAVRTGQGLSPPPPKQKSVSNCHCRHLLLPVRAASALSSWSTVLSELVVIQRQYNCCRARRDLKDDAGPDGRHLHLSMAGGGGKKNWPRVAQGSEAEVGKLVAVVVVVVVAEQMWRER